MDNLYNILNEAQAVVAAGEFDMNQIHPNLPSFHFTNGTPACSYPASYPSSYPAPLVAPQEKVLPHKAAKNTKKRTWKKPKDKPKRPLSAYNLFFQSERKNIIAALPGDLMGIDDGLTEEQRRRKHRKTHGKIGFADLAKAIGEKWKMVDKDARSEFEKRAETEKARYLKELEVWKKSQKDVEKPKPKPVRKRSPPSPPKNVPTISNDDTPTKIQRRDPRPESLTSMMTVAMNKQFNQLMAANMAQMLPQNLSQANEARFHHALMKYCGDDYNHLPSSQPATMDTNNNSACGPSKFYQQQNNYNNGMHQQYMSPSHMNNGMRCMNQQQQVHPQQGFHHNNSSMIPNETFSKETFFEEYTTVPVVVDISGDSDDDDEETTSNPSLEDDLHFFMNEFEADL